MKHCAKIRTSLKKSFLLVFLFAWQHVCALNGDTSALITTENEVTSPVVVNYIFNSDGTLNNSHKYANVVYYKLEWKNNKWVRTFEKASTNISITGAEFPVWDVYTVMRYYNESELLAERIYGADGIERDPTALLSNSNTALSVTHQAAKHLSVFINSELNSLFSDEEYTAECVKVSDGYDVNVTVFDKRGMTEFKVKVSEFSIHLDNAMSREEMTGLLDYYGMKRSYSYEYYLFSNNFPHTIERWAIFQDESVKQPPLAVQFLADILMGIPGAIYGFSTGKDWRTGETLTGWDHVFNALEIIPVAGAFGKTFKYGIKTLKVFKAGEKFLDVVDAAKKLNMKFMKQVGKLKSKGLRLAGDAADNMKLVLGKTGEQLAQITDKGLIRLKNSVIPPVFTVLLDMGQLPVKFGDEFLEAEVKVVKYGDEVGVVVEKVDDFIPTLLNKVDNVENAVVSVAKNESEILDELVKTNNAVTENAKKFWAQHEMNVTSYLENTYGSTKVGQQITVDVYIQGSSTPIRCRVDNLIDVGGGKFRIADGKSSIVNNLSTKTPEQLLNSMSTANQKSFYNALKNGTVTQIKPAGARAEAFFTSGGRQGIPTNGIQVEKSIDFFVNDVSTNGYNMFQKTLVQ